MEQIWNTAPFVDSHCHLDVEQFEPDRPQVIHRAREAGIRAIVIPAIEPATFDHLQSVVLSDPMLFWGVGIHPHSVGTYEEESLEVVESWIQKGERVVAIGEIGLDYYYDFSPRDKQKAFFRDQIRLAKQYQLPVIIHNREADEDIFRIVEQEQDGTLRGVFHCFSGSPALAERALKLQMCVSFTGMITFPKVQLQETVQAVPLEQMMIETDSPYLTPVPYRGKRNEPSRLPLIAAKIAEWKKTTIEEVAEKTTQTAMRLFRLAIATLAVFLLAFLLPFRTTAQQDTVRGFAHPFQKFIGGGGIIGMMTFVETPDSGRDRSYEGLPAFGGVLNWFFTDHLFLSASYVIAKNTKVQRFQANPNYHHVLDFAINYTPIPYNRMAFYFSLGMSYFYNNLNNRRKENFLGSNFAIGLYGNIRTPYGVIVPSAEWRVSFMLGDRILDYDPNPNDQNPERIRQNVPYFTSIPRFLIQFFPEW